MLKRNAVLPGYDLNGDETCVGYQVVSTKYANAFSLSVAGSCANRVAGNIWRRITIRDITVGYRAFVLPCGTINVGTFNIANWSYGHVR